MCLREVVGGRVLSMFLESGGVKYIVGTREVGEI